jgi:hypothetical protein
LHGLVSSMVPGIWFWKPKYGSCSLDSWEKLTPSSIGSDYS